MKCQLNLIFSEKEYINIHLPVSRFFTDNINRIRLSVTVKLLSMYDPSTKLTDHS